MRPVLALDFDGVIHSYVSGWKGPRTIPDAPVPGALKFLVAARYEYAVHIFSSRSNYFLGRRAMKEWLIYHLEREMRHNMDALWVNGLIRDFFQLKRRGQVKPLQIAKWFVHNRLEFPNHKPPAVCTIDDRAVRFDGKFREPSHYKNLSVWYK